MIAAGWNRDIKQCNHYVIIKITLKDEIDMLFDAETRYWQEEYEKGNLDDIDMLGETRTLLDGTAEREFFGALKYFLLSLPTMLLMGTFGVIQKGNNVWYMEMAKWLQDHYISFGTNVDPFIFVLSYVIILTVVLNIIITRKIRSRLR